jgi:hypothetical protein
MHPTEQSLLGFNVDQVRLENVEKNVLGGCKITLHEKTD